MEINPIALFRTQKKNPFDAARQGAADISDEMGEIQFFKNHNFEQALDDIEGFSHLWLIYQFHHNTEWKPKVLPPRGSDQKIGVFATRSPYRPNALGLSCVQLVDRSGLILRVKAFDLLDETPIFDVKPYVASADSFPEARMGWLENIDSQKFAVHLGPLALSQLEFLKAAGVTELENFIHQQLSFEPLNGRKKRVKETSESQAVLAYRTWRVLFQVIARNIEVQSIQSGYSAMEMLEKKDPYQDKDLHRAFAHQFQK